MRKLLISLSAAASTLLIAAPASAQWFPPAPPPYGYAGPGAGQEMQARVAGIRAHIRGLAARGMLSWPQANRLDREAAAIDRQIWRHPYMSFGTHADLEARIANLQRWVDVTVAQNMRFGPRLGYGW